MSVIHLINRKFELVFECQWEGDFARYANGDYVNEAQQEAFFYFAAGWHACELHNANPSQYKREPSMTHADEALEAIEAKRASLQELANKVGKDVEKYEAYIGKQNHDPQSAAKGLSDAEREKLRNVVVDAIRNAPKERRIESQTMEIASGRIVAEKIVFSKSYELEAESALTALEQLCNISVKPTLTTEGK